MTSIFLPPSRLATAGEGYQPVSHREEWHRPYCHMRVGAWMACGGLVA